MRIEVAVPKLGEGVFEAKVSELRVEEGARLVEDQIYMVIETDKVDIELPSPHTGTVVEVKARKGDIRQTGELLLVLESEESQDVARRNEDTANARTALQYLATQDPEHLCSRSELSDYTFDDAKGFIKEVVSLAKRCQRLSFDRLDDSLVPRMQAALFFVTNLFAELIRFNPGVFSSLAEHARISRAIRDYQGEALQKFVDVLSSAGRAAGETAPAFESTVRLRDRAYVFISCSHAEAQFARGLVERLQRQGLDSFLYATSIGWGQEIPKIIHEALDRATHLVVLISPGSEQSGWVAYEVGNAKGKGIEIFPYRMYPEMRSPGFIHDLKCLESGDDEADWIRKLESYRRSPQPPPSQGLFAEWDVARVCERLGQAKEVWHQAVASSTFLGGVLEELSALVGLERGGSLHCILVDPNGAGIKMAARRTVGAVRDVEAMRKEVELAKIYLGTLAGKAPREDGVQLKQVNFLLEPILTIIDPQSPDGTMFVTLSGFGQPLTARPSLVLRKSADEKLFSFYANSFDRLWSDPIARTVPLRRQEGDAEAASPDAAVPPEDTW